jgi:hypothetical protein
MFSNLCPLIVPQPQHGRSYREGNPCLNYFEIGSNQERTVIQRLAIILFICVAGCSDWPATPPPTTPQELQGDGVVNTDGHSAHRSQLSKITIGGIVLKPKAVLGGKLALLVPDEFLEMDGETLKLKYPSERRPPLVYLTNQGQ